MKCFWFFLLLVLAATGPGCDSSSRNPSPDPGPRKERHEGKYEIVVKDVTAYVDIVYTEEGRQNGLMFRKSLPRDEGMLFIFPEEEIRSFWMKNTLIPLSTAFFTQDGYIVNIVDMIPEGDVPDYQLKSYTSEIPAKYVLEMNLGWFEEHGVKAGDFIALPESILSIVPE